MSNRSWLFVPGGAPRMMTKAQRSGADWMILDLEDAVQPDGKEQAREAVAAFLADAAPAESPRRAVRVNGLDTPWCEADLHAVLPLGPEMVMLPKAEGPEDVERLSQLIARHERAPGATGILVVATETPSAVMSLFARSWAHPRLRGLLWGGEDLSTALGAAQSRDASGRYLPTIDLARSACLYAARIAGVLAIDAVFTDFRDARSLRDEAEAAHHAGFDGKAAIHPAQLDVINPAFSDSDATIAWAQAVCAALGRSTTGVAIVDGQMVDPPHLARARRILARRSEQ